MDIEKTMKSLKSRGFGAEYFETKEAAAAWLDARLDGREIGMGGSMTLAAMGIYDLLRAHNRVLWHTAVTPPDPELSRQAALLPVYITSANAIAETGEIVNIDGRGNRVAATMFFKDEVYIIVGINKLCPDLDAAVTRARTVAAPLNAKRLGTHTPCAADGKCHDCRSPGRICAGLVTLMGRMASVKELTVVIIGEELGF